MQQPGAHVPWNRLGAGSVPTTTFGSPTPGRPERPASSPRCTTSPTAWSGASQEIEGRKALIAADASLGLRWSVVESLPVPEAIKLGEGDLEPLFENYRQSLRNLAALRRDHRLLQLHAGARLDAHRTRAIRCPAAARRCASTRTSSRPSTASCWSAPARRRTIRPRSLRARAGVVRAESRNASRQKLLANIMAGLPGAFDRYDIPGLRRMLDRYRGMTRERLRENLARFLREVIPTAEEVGVRMCDPPGRPAAPAAGPAADRLERRRPRLHHRRGRFGRQRHHLLHAARSGRAPPTTCRPWPERFAARIHFAHLRNVPQGAGRLVHGGRPSRRRRRHGGGGRRRCWRSRSAGAMPAIRAGASRSGPTTATNCWTTSASRRIPAIRRSAG